MLDIRSNKRNGESDPKGSLETPGQDGDGGGGGLLEGGRVLLQRVSGKPTQLKLCCNLDERTPKLFFIQPTGAPLAHLATDDDAEVSKRFVISTSFGPFLPFLATSTILSRRSNV